VNSCADADHIVGELIKRFMLLCPLDDATKSKILNFGEADLANKLQASLRAINLCFMSALSTAFANEVEPNYGNR